MSDVSLARTGLHLRWKPITNGRSIAVLFAVLVLVGFAGCKKSGPAKGGGSNSDPPAPAGPGPLGLGPAPKGTGPLGLDPASGGNPDLLVNVSVQFPTTKPFAAGYNPQPHEVLTIQLVAVGITAKNDPPALMLAVLDYYGKKLDALAGGQRNRTARRVDAPDGKSILQTIRLAPVTEDAAAFAKKIDFGTVRGIHGREIILVVRAENVPLSEELLKSLPSKTPPNPRTIDAARLMVGMDLVGQYRENEKAADAKYTGQQMLCLIHFPDMVRDADGKACVLLSGDMGKSRPCLVVRLANEAGWKEGARSLKEQLYLEGKVVGQRAVADLPWMRNWARLPQPFGTQGKVVVIEGGKIVTPIEYPARPR